VHSVPQPPTRPVVGFVDSLSNYPDKVAVCTESGHVTYAELTRRVAETAQRLGRERRLVLIAAHNALDVLVCYLAALSAGHVVLLTSADAPQHVAGLVDTFDPDVLYTRGAGGWHLAERRCGTRHDLHPDLALLLSTSGSTGSANLVRLSYENLHSNAEAISEYLDITAADRAITTLPMQYCYGLSVIHSHLARGASLVLTDRSVTDDRFWDLFGATRPTSFAGVPHTFALLDRIGFERMHLPSLRYVTQAGGRMAPEDTRRFVQLGVDNGWDFVAMYGQTEATARIAYLPPSLARENPQAIGVAIPGGELTIEPSEDADHCEAHGELVYRGANVMLGYAEHSRDLALGRTVDALRTGDLARRVENGLFEIVGRRSRFVKIFGLRLDLGQIEQRLQAEGIDCLCTGVDETLVVAVTLDADSQRVRSAVKRDFGLSRNSVRVVVTPTLPRFDSGKPNYLAVGALAASATNEAANEAANEATTGATTAAATAAAGDAPVCGAATTSRREDIRRNAIEVLGVDDIACGDTFTSLGGDSLSYVEMSILIEDTLGYLPDDWHVTPLLSLAEVPDAATRPRPNRAWRANSREVEAVIPLRAGAILLVVGLHLKLWPVAGGAQILMALAGFSFARFQLTRTRATDQVRNMVTSLARFAVPVMVFVAALVAIGDRYEVVNIFFVNHWFPPVNHASTWELWFIEALVEILLVLCLAFAVPAVRRAERRHQFEFAVIVLAIGLCIRFSLADGDWRPDMSSPRSMLWIFAIGWVAERATRSWQRAVLTLVIGIGFWGLYGDTTREIVAFGGTALLIWVNTVRLPTQLVRPVGAVASASLWIYLTHWQVFPTMIHHGISRKLAFAASILVGVAAWHVVRKLTAWVERTARLTFSPGARPAGGQEGEPDGLGVALEGDFDGDVLVPARALR